MTNKKNQDMYLSNLDNTFKVSNNSEIYAFRSQAAFNTAVQFTADLISYYNYEADESDKKSDDYLVKLISTARLDLKESLIDKANQYGEFSIDNMEAAYYAIEENGTEQERNFKDLVQSAVGNPNFWSDVFYNSKISSIGRNTDFADEAFKIALMESTDESTLSIAEQSDETDQSTKQWNFGNNISNFNEHVSTVVRQYFDTLQRLNSTEKFDNDDYDVDRNNPLGVPMCHTYQECTIELSNVISNLGGFKSIKDFIDIVKIIANNKKEFVAFIQLADDMEANDDFANKIYTDLNKFTVDKLELAIDGFGTIKSIQSNNSNNPVRKLYFNLRNDLKGTSIQNDNISIEADIEDVENRFKEYKKNSTVSKAKLANRPGIQERIAEQCIIDFNNIVRDIKEIYKLYFPSMNELAIDNFIERNNSTSKTYRVDNIDELISYLYKVNWSAKKSLAEKQSRDLQYREVQKENWKRRKDYEIAKAHNIDAGKYIEKELPKFTGEYLIGADEVIGNISIAIEPYIYSKAELNSRNVEGNLNSDIIYNNFLTNIAKICGDRKTLNTWIKEKLKSTEYNYSNILIDRPDQGIVGLFRQKANGEYEVSPYGEKIISIYLLNGVSNQQYGTNTDYTKMSDGDYYLVGLYAYTKKLQTYKKYNTVKSDTIDVETAPFLMRIPSDAPKNFAISMPKYSTEELWNYDYSGMDAYVKSRVSDFVKTINIDNKTEQITKLKHTKLSIDEVVNLITNTPENIKTSPGKILEMKIKEGDKCTVVYSFTTKEGTQYHYFKGTFQKDGKGDYILNKPEYVGGAQFNEYNSYFDSAINSYVREEFKTLHPVARTMNHKHPIFNSIMNIVKGEMFDYAKALYDVDNNDVNQLVEWFHYNPRDGVRKNGKLTGNAFKFIKLDNKVGYDVEAALEELMTNASSTGELSLEGYDNGGNNSAKLNMSTNVQQQLEQIVERWIDAYSNYVVEETHTKFGSFLYRIGDSEIIEYGLNTYIHNNNFDDLFEGNAKYYKDPQTFFKRAKEIQAGGTSYSIANYNNTEDNESPFTQAINEIPNSEILVNGESIIVGNKPLTLRTGWNGIVIKNTVRASSNKNALYDQLIKSGVSKEKATELAEGFGYTEPDKGENNATTTKVNDAQSYITIYEAARRLKILGEFSKYEKLIGQLTDNSPISDINPNELGAFIQVMKNFYYDHYYNSRFGRHLPRQIKNAEFVLVPKFLEGNSLGDLAKFMIENDIDQVNTQETSKAANYDVLTFWDDNGEVIPANLKEFTNKAKEVKQPFSYMYLYKQQDVPQHITDAQNKAGIQVMKKVLDNSVAAVSSNKNNFIKAYVANIREDFNSLMSEYGVKFDKDYRIINENGGKVDYSRIYRLALIEASRLGLDSNTIDYLSVKNPDAGPVMPNYMNIVSSKIESIAQSQFNKFITRQKLPGWHAAQITSVGLEGHIRQAKGQTTETTSGKRVELAYHADKNTVEILLPKWASNMFNQYDKDGNLIKEIKIEDVDPEVLECIGYRIPTEGKQSMAVMKVVGFLPEWMGSTIVVPDEWVTQTGSGFGGDSIYSISYETFLGTDGRIHKIEYNAADDNINAKKRYIQHIKSKRIKLNSTADKFSTTVFEADDTENEFKQAELIASQMNLISFTDFSKLSIEEQNTRRSRNNRILDSMIAIMQDSSNVEENLARSHFDDLMHANKVLDKMDGSDKVKVNVYNLFDQILFHRNAMSGARLKALSVSRDTGNSIFNVSKAELKTPIRIKYGNGVDLSIAEQALPVKDGIVYHDRIGNSRNNKNVVGDYITTASSHTTAHILDAIKAGAIKNENEYTFAAFKTLFDIGSDAYTAILWLRQPGISRIVEAYHESQSVFSKNNLHPTQTAIKRIAADLGIKIRNVIVNDSNNITEVIKVHISVIPTQRFRSYPPSVFTDTWLSFANLLFLSQTLSFNIKTM